MRKHGLVAKSLIIKTLIENSKTLDFGRHFGTVPKAIATCFLLSPPNINPLEHLFFNHKVSWSSLYEFYHKGQVSTSGLIISAIPDLLSVGMLDLDSWNSVQ